MKNKLAFLLLASLSFNKIYAATTDKTTYISCLVYETIKKEKVKVTVKFAIKNLDLYKKKGELITYPGLSEEEVEEGNGPILVTPKKYKGEVINMTNLNGQGGDLRITDEGVRLFGDGAGYQFTNLVVWDLEQDDLESFDGYVRDYGSTYGDQETFKQFIKCKASNKVL